MPTLNATVYPNEAYVLVEADWSGALFRQTFGTDSASNWPVAETGQTFTVRTGVAADFTSSGGKGIITHSAVNTIKRITVDGLSMADFDSSGQFTNTVIPTGNNFEVGFGGRWVDANNFVEARMFLTSGGTVSFSIRQVVGGAETNGGFPTIAGLPTSGVYNWRFVGIGATLYFRVWLAGTVEPLTWTGTFTTTWLTAGTVQYMTTVAAGVTNPVPISFTLDNLVVTDPNAVVPTYATVTRRNTATGEIVTLRPYIAYDDEGNLLLDCGMGLWWDTEPPLDVPLEYCTVAEDVPALLSQNSTFESSSAPWTAVNGATIAQDCTVAHSGSCSLRITPNGTTANPGAQQAVPMAIMGGVPVTISGWVMAPNGWNAVNLALTVTYVDGLVETVTTPIEIIDDGLWRFMTTTFTPRLNITGNATLALQITGIPSGATLFYLDDVGVYSDSAITATACETVTVPGNGNFWLKNPLHPCLDVLVGICNPMLEDCDSDSRVSYVGMVEESFAPNSVLLQPVNRRRPIPVNRIRRDVESTLRLIAHDCDARDAIRAANEPGDPLLWQAPATYCIADRYMSVGVLTETKISIDEREDFRLISLPHVAVDRPAGPADGVCGARIMDLCDIYTSWGAMTIAGLTWIDLLLGEASPNGPGQPEPPAAARTWGSVKVEFANWSAVEAGGARDWGELRDGL